LDGNGRNEFQDRCLQPLGHHAWRAKALFEPNDAQGRLHDNRSPFIRLALGCVLLALALIGCGDDGGNEPAGSGAEGTWTGTITGHAQEGSLEWILQDTDGEISGTGSLSTATAGVALTIEGTFSPPNLTLTVSPEGVEDFSFFGTVGEESMKGRLNGAGFINRTVTLDRR
jgi:hypothetical protein